MTLNAPPYDVRVWLYPGVNPIGDWGPKPEDISAYVRYPGGDGGQPITYSAGRQNEADQVDAGTMNLTLDNRTGRFSTGYFLGPYYGQLDSNTPIRMGMVTCTDTFTRTVSSSGLGTSDTGNTWALSVQPWSVDGSKAQYGGAANASGFAVNQGGSALDVDSVVTVTANATAAGDIYYGGLIFRYQDTSNLVRVQVQFLTNGNAELRIMRTVAGSTFITSTVALGAYTAGSSWRLHAMVIRDRIYANAWNLSGGSESATWQATGSAGSLTGRATGIFGSRNSANTNSNCLAFDNYQSIGLEWAGLVSAWPVDWDMSGNNCWAAITCNGILRRLQQGKGDVRSALARQLPAYSPTGYWPLEDGPKATTFGPATTFTSPGVIFGGVTPSGGDGPDGGGPTPSLSDATGAISVQVPSSRSIGSADGFSAMFLVKFDTAPSVRTYVATFSVSGPGTYYRWSVDSTSSYIEIYDLNGTQIGTQTNSLPWDMSDWNAFQLETSISGANTAWSFIGHTVGAVNYFAQTGTYSGTTISKCTGILMNPFAQCAAGTQFAHAWIGPNTLPFVTDSFSKVSSGYAGELASARAARVGAEAGIPIMVESGDSAPMGPQPIADPLTTLRSCQDADQGILYERDNGLGFRPHTVRFNRPVDLVLTVASGHLAAPPRGITDDQRLKNKVTATRDGGSSSTALDQDSIDRSGEYPESLTVVVETDSQVVDLAGWRVYLGVYPAMRWPQISLQLTRLADAVQVWRGRSFGMRMQVVTGRPQIMGSDPDMVIEGYSGTLWPHGWEVQTNCSTATAWDVATLDDSGLRLDADSSTLSADITTTTAASCSVTNGGDGYSSWVPTSTYPAEVPFDIRINGEIMTVTNVGNVSAGVQTLTITRGINGGSKIHAAGSEVHLAYPTVIVF